MSPILFSGTSIGQPAPDALPHVGTLPKQHDKQGCDKPRLPLCPSEATVPLTARDLWREAVDKLEEHARQELNLRDSKQK
jgi:hypothetical protein